MAKSTIVLSFHSILIHQSDIHLLSGPYWLNDTIISFYFEYLEKKVFRNAKELLFVSPEVTQCIKMVQEDEIPTFLEPLGVSKKQFVFFALNDHNTPDMAGGSHWSLLIYSKPESCFFHLDSSFVSNHKAAQELASHLMPYLSKGNIEFVNKDCVQQGNGYDCGVHVICNAEKIAKHAHHTGEIANCEMRDKISPSAKREEILKIIYSLTGKE